MIDPLLEIHLALEIAEPIPSCKNGHLILVVSLQLVYATI